MSGVIEVPEYGEHSGHITIMLDKIVGVRHPHGSSGCIILTETGNISTSDSYSDVLRNIEESRKI